MKKLLIILICSIMASCQMMVEVDVPRDPLKIVVNCIFSADTAWLVSVNRTRYVLDEYTDYYLPDAEVTLRDENGNEVVLTEQPLGSIPINIGGLHFLSNSKPAPGVTYELRVTANGYTPVVATAKVPELVEIVDARLDSANMTVDQHGWTTIPVAITLRDPIGKGDHYYPQMFTTYDYQMPDPETGELKTYEGTQILELRKSRTNEEDFIDVDGDDRNVATDDENFDGKVYTYRLFASGYSGGPVKSVQLNLHRATRDYARYFISERIQNETDGNPFAQPVQVYSNIEGGLGIFAGYSTSSWEFVK